jgi:hypothetical protein
MGSATDIDLAGPFAPRCIPRPTLPSPILAADNHPQPHLADSCGVGLWENSVMSSLLGQCAVVIGAGIGGLSMAGALAPYFERIDILECDRLVAATGSRPGTPHDRHPHGLLAGGLSALDQIFLGFKSDLAAAGAVSGLVAREVQFERPDVGVLPNLDFGASLFLSDRW